MLNVNDYNDAYDFEICGASYIGEPRSNTVMFVAKKVEYLVENLTKATNCLVFAEKGIEVSLEFEKNHCIIKVDKPQLEYAKVVTKIADAKFNEEKMMKFTLTDEGYYVGQNVEIGENAYIEPGCLIGHNVKIGSNARVYAGAVVKNAIIGDNVIINERAVIGSAGFSLTEDEDGNRIRIPTLGRVIIGNNVEIGTLNNVAQGNAGDTYIDDYAKTDALVYIGHDVHLHRNVKVAAGCDIAGFVEVEEEVYLGINSSVRNRIMIEHDSIIGMGAVVTKSVTEYSTMIGNPAREMMK